MKVFYTRHAKQRMRWRKISREEVEQTLGAPERTETIRPGRNHFYRTIGRRYIRVTTTYEQGTHVIISAVDKSD